MKKRYVFAISCLIAVANTACFVTQVDDKHLTDAALRASLAGSGSNCSVNGFKQMVLPSLRTNCASCHSGGGPGVGSFATGDVNTAYAAAAQRVSFGSPSSSLLVSRSAQAGHGGGCAACGNAWGQSLAAMIQDWARADSGDPSICNNLSGVVDDSDTSTTVRGDDGDYTPPNPDDTIVVPEGLNKFSEPAGVQSILRNNCIQCHVPGGLALFAPFAVADSLQAYREAKPRVNFASIASSRIVSRAATPNHGGDCRICGDSAFVANLTARLEEWKQVESVSVASLQVRLNNKLVGLNPTVNGQTLTMTWNLGSEILPGNPALIGGQFSMRVSISSVGGGTTYRFSEPRLIAPGGTAVQVKELVFVLNGVDQPYVTTYRQISQTVPAGSNVVLASFPALVPLMNANTDSIGVVFSVLKQP